uniref:pentatricopeptide repeat-containing protein At3g29230 isoform X2 n=1 Tax=Erigeron canadensis TaxID=72917 RepID=UPI001CB90517|nr:pentatricopeptide repeat-containing protein At3g29230 isoform X2 [Erigeron canadensis]
MPDPNSAPWNAMFKGYIDNHMCIDVLTLFGYMVRMNVKPTYFTIPMVLKSCVKLSALKDGEKVHCFVVKVGFLSNPFVGTTLIDMYCSGGNVGYGYKVFGEIGLKNVVTWTSMIRGYILFGDVSCARKMFDLAPERDLVMWNTMVTGYIECGDMDGARKLFDVMPNKDLMSWNTLLNGYANNKDMEGCEKLFKEMSVRNFFSWNALINGYAHNNRFIEVIGTFKMMLNDPDVQPNDATFASVLSACSKLGMLELGKWVHAYAVNIGYKQNTYVQNGLIDMYAKCGAITKAMDVFTEMNEKDLISWNTIINALAMHGNGSDALRLFHEMKSAKQKPDAITFIGVICACSHMGLVKDGLKYFNSMVDGYLITPKIEHYGCIVDLLSRAGLVEEAVEFVEKMPMKPDNVIWTNLLGASRIYKKVKIAELCLQRLIELEPENPSNYVMLSNIYGDAKRPDDFARSKVAMRNTGAKKLPGCSSIEVDDAVVEFYAFDERHSKTEAIYSALRSLLKVSKDFGCFAVM